MLVLPPALPSPQALPAHWRGCMFIAVSMDLSSLYCKNVVTSEKDSSLNLFKILSEVFKINISRKYNSEDPEDFIMANQHSNIAYLSFNL